MAPRARTKDGGIDAPAPAHEPARRTCCRAPSRTSRSACPDHIVLGMSAQSHVDAATLRRALERMDAAWSEGEERMAKLSVNAMIGLCARSTEVVYSVRSSSSELDGAGADFSQSYERGIRLRQEAAEQRHLPPHPRRGPRL